jgi:hypothetical protein
MNVTDAIARFRRAAKNGKVNNARTGEGVSLTPATEDAIVSTVSSAFRFAAGTDDLTRIDYDTYAEVLPEWALADAETHGLSDASNRAARCRRFVRTVDGKQYKQTRPLSRVPLPAEWQSLGIVLHSAQFTQRRQNRQHSKLVKLAMTLGPLGIRSPHQLPDRVELKRLLTHEAGLKTDDSNRLLSAFREIRQLAAASGQFFPDIDQCPATHERGLRSLPDIVTRLAKAGCSAGIDQVTTIRIIELLAPSWYQAMKAFMASKPRASEGWKRRLVYASSRMLAELARTAAGDLATTHPTRLLLEQVDTGEVIEVSVPGGDDWARDLFGDAAVATDGSAAAKTVHIPLIARLATTSSSASSQNSCLRPVDDLGEAFWTETIQADVQIIGDMGLFAGSALFERHPDIRQRAESDLAAFRKRMRDEKELRSFGGRKGKEALLNLATFPMILFLGLPALRKRALLRRDEMHAAMIRHPNAACHPKVVKAERRYHRALLKYVLFAFFYADGLRIANYSHARLGSASKDAGMVTRPAPCGTHVRSYTHVAPQLDRGAITGVLTNFFGDDHPRVKLKIDRVPGTRHWRTRPHWVRPGLLDFDLLLEYLNVVRPQNLERQALIPSAEDYDLITDIHDLHFALFVSPTASTDPYRAVTGAYAPQTIAQIFGRTLYWVLTEVLGRTLPPYGSDELKQKYPRLFGPHIVRLQAGSFIYGILGRVAEAQTLLNDTLQTVERRYTVVEATMVHKTGWEAPHFFDKLFERVWDGNEVLDWDVVAPLAGIPTDRRPPGLDSVV